MSIGLRRSIECSEAELTEIVGEEKKALPIMQKTNRTGSTKKQSGEEKAIANIQREEYCVLNHGGKLSIDYTLKIVDLFHIELINKHDPDSDKLIEFIYDLKEQRYENIVNKLGYKEDHEKGMELLQKAQNIIAFGFANRIISARTAWRNLDT